MLGFQVTLSTLGPNLKNLLFATTLSILVYPSNLTRQ